jgi:hypothetical protein
MPVDSLGSVTDSGERYLSSAKTSDRAQSPVPQILHLSDRRRFRAQPDLFPLNWALNPPDSHRVSSMVLYRTLQPWR